MDMSNEHRGGFSGSIGLLLSAIGSAVGLGNLWGFPYKMGRSGGFMFLLLYLLLALFVGIPIMMSEFALGRKTGKGPFGAYRAADKRFTWLGWIGTIVPFLIMFFYSVLGGYCLFYIWENIVGIVSGMPTGMDTFVYMITHKGVSILVMLLFLGICFSINRSTISEGVEKFNKIGMPALAVMLIIIIARALSLPHAEEGLKFMFVPGYAVDGGFIESTPSAINVLATAGGQMFFSLSLAMGIMIAYGSYIPKGEPLTRSSIIVTVSDTLIALLAGFAVIPAAVANGIAQGIPVSQIKLSGPLLLFVTLQDVFTAMGPIGGVFGIIFFLLVLIAAITSAISLIEAASVHFIDVALEKGKTGARPRIVLIVCILIAIGGTLVAADGLGSNGFAPWQVFGMADASAGAWCEDWLDFFDLFAEGIMMPFGAMMMCIMFGWFNKKDYLLDEIHDGSGSGTALDGFWWFCTRYVAPIAMFFILLAQIDSFFSLGWF